MDFEQNAACVGRVDEIERKCRFNVGKERSSVQLKPPPCLLRLLLAMVIWSTEKMTLSQQGDSLKLPSQVTRRVVTKPNKCLPPGILHVGSCKKPGLIV